MVDFPRRMGWEIDRQNGPLRVDETKSNIESPVALLQAWLFFGFLKDVFSIGGAEIDLHEISTAGRRHILSLHSGTEKLFGQSGTSRLAT